MIYEVGSIVRAFIPFTNTVGGKERPCVVIHSNSNETTFVVFLTGGNEVYKNKHTNVYIEPDSVTNKLSKPSVAFCEVIYTKRTDELSWWKPNARLSAKEIQDILQITQAEVERRKI